MIHGEFPAAGAGAERSCPGLGTCGPWIGSGMTSSELKLNADT